MKLFMNLIILFKLGCALAAGNDGAPEGMAPGNPVLSKFAENITFYVNFDESSMVPTLAAGSSNIRSKTGEFAFEKGILGKCLRSGQASYFGAKNLDFTAPGTVIFWMAPWKWEETAKEGYFWPFIGFTDKSKLTLGRQGGKLGKTRIYAYVTTPKGKKNIYLGVAGGSAKNWRAGQWHMITMTWTPDSIGISVDGKKLLEKSLEEPLGTKPNWFLFGAQKTANKGLQVLQDEFVVLNKKLSDDDIKTLYNETIKISSGK
jgi:hypothetical protein